MAAAHQEVKENAKEKQPAGGGAADAAPTNTLFRFLERKKANLLEHNNFHGSQKLLFEQLEKEAVVLGDIDLDGDASSVGKDILSSASKYAAYVRLKDLKDVLETPNSIQSRLEKLLGRAPGTLSDAQELKTLIKEELIKDASREGKLLSSEDKSVQFAIAEAHLKSALGGTQSLPACLPTYLPAGATLGGPDVTGWASQEKAGNILLRRISEEFGIPDLTTLYVSAMKGGDAAKNEFIEVLETAVEFKFNQVGTTEDLTETMNCARDSMVFKNGNFFEDTELFTDEHCLNLLGK
jgi:hypothetical protein